MNPLCIHSYTWLGVWTDNDGHRAIERAAELGYDQIVIPLAVMENVHPDKTVKVLERCGIRCANTFAYAPEDNIAGDDDAGAARGETKLHTALAMARDLNTVRINGFLHTAYGGGVLPPSPRARARVVGILGRAAEKAKEYGFPIAVEVGNRYESAFLNTVDQALAAIGETGSDNLFLHLDTFHMNIDEGDMIRAIETANEKILYIEIVENHRGYLGTGNVDFPRVFRALAKIGYSGPLGFEAFSAHTASPGQRTALRLWRDMWQDSDDLAAHAKRFIETHWDSARRMV